MDGGLQELNKQSERPVYLISSTRCPLEAGSGAGVPQQPWGWVAGTQLRPCPPPPTALPTAAHLGPGSGSSGWRAGRSWEGARSAWEGVGPRRLAPG